MANESSSSEIDDQVWSVLAAAVAANDRDGMAATYHPDAVLVSGEGTKAVARQPEAWGDGMEKIRAEGRSASVAFRFSSRQADAATAFECGMFRYAETTADGVEEPSFVPFEALLVKKDGRWLMVMERQFEAAGRVAWDKMLLGDA